MDYTVKDITQAPQGRLKVEWAEKEMPVLRKVGAEFKKNKPLKGLKVAACLHVTKETAVLVKTLQVAGAEVSLCASNPLSTQDDVAAALAKDGVRVHAFKHQTDKEYYECLHKTLDIKPDITIDDGADLIFTIHTKRTELLKNVWAGQEETTTGVIRLKSMAAEGALKYPVVAVNDTPTKHMFDNHYGTGQSTVDGVLRSTNILIAGKKVVVAGYGHCGSGIAAAFRGMGGHVMVTEVDPVKALKAVMDGYHVVPMKEAAKLGDVFLTATGNKDVITKEHMALMKDGAILGNSGHFNVEISLRDLQALSLRKKVLRDGLEEYQLKEGKKIYLIAEGRLLNLAAAEGHPSAVMDMSFANQALTCAWLAENHKQLKAGVLDVPEDIDRKVAALKLASMGSSIDKLTKGQVRYLSGWQEGT